MTNVPNWLRISLTIVIGILLIILFTILFRRILIFGVAYVIIFWRNGDGCFDTSVKGGEMMEYIISFALLVMIIVLVIKK